MRPFKHILIRWQKFASFTWKMSSLYLVRLDVIQKVKSSRRYPDLSISYIEIDTFQDSLKRIRLQERCNRENQLSVDKTI